MAKSVRGFLGIAGLLLLLAVVPGSLADYSAPSGDSLFTWKFADKSPANAAALRSKFEVAGNPAFAKSEFSTTAITFSRVRIGPCVVRTMHLHRNADELYFTTSGKVAYATAFPNGTIVHDITYPGESFVMIRNWVHTFYNPDCHEDATLLSFINANESFTSNVGIAAFNIDASPFKAYADPRFVQSIENALPAGFFAVDPTCLARCGLGPVNGQLPAPTYSNNNRYTR